ncbi:hypothetical protein R3P38DRAFT_3213820 [Favolaschia claudopus]|uniref:Uncharacterized protein n=1 Tax=Favolaschia claudopus TaxID=2862362 RepID=A0AAW0ACC6_9AGAR
MYRTRRSPTPTPSTNVSQPRRSPAFPLPPPVDIYSSVITAPPAAEHHVPHPIPHSWQRPLPDEGTIEEMRERSRFDNLPQHTRTRTRPGPPPSAAADPVVPRLNPFFPQSTTTATLRKSKKDKNTQMCRFLHGIGEDAAIPSPPYNFTRSDISPLLHTLHQYCLSFEFAIAKGTKDLWSQLNAAIEDHATLHGLEFPPNATDLSIHAHFETSSWQVLHTRSNQASAQRKFIPVDWYEYDYTETKMSAVAKAIPHPGNCVNIPAPSTALSQSNPGGHIRTGWQSSSLSDPPLPPTTRRRVASPPAGGSSSHARSPTPDFPPTQDLLARALDKRQEAAAALTPPPPPPLDIPPLKSWQRATGLDLLEWISTITSIAAREQTVPLVIRGGSHNASEESIFATEANVYCPPVADLAFLVHGRHFRLETNDPELGARGEGPERVVHARAIEAEALSSGSLDDFYVDGRYAALFILRMEAAPMPISPFFIFAATQSERPSLRPLTFAFINTLDPDTARVLHPWFQIRHDTLVDDPTHPAAVLLEHYLDLTIDWLCQPRTTEEHDNVHIRLLECCLLGGVDIWDTPGFAEFQRGLRLELGEPSDEFTPAPTMGDHWSSADKAMRLPTCLYDRGVRQPDDLIRRLQITIHGGDRPPSAAGVLYAKLFTWRLHRWLHGSGYPRALKGVFVDRNTASSSPAPLSPTTLAAPGASLSPTMPYNTFRYIPPAHKRLMITMAANGMSNQEIA